MTSCGETFGPAFAGGSEFPRGPRLRLPRPVSCLLSRVVLSVLRASARSCWLSQPLLSLSCSLRSSTSSSWPGPPPPGRPPLGPPGPLGGCCAGSEDAVNRRVRVYEKMERNDMGCRWFGWVLMGEMI